MGSYDVREQTYRTRTRSASRDARGERTRVDFVTTAITAQIILCALLLLCVFGIKKLDEELYYRTKTECTGLQGASHRIELGAAFGGIFNGDADDGKESIIEKAKALAEEFFSAKPITEEEANPQQESQAESRSAAQYDYLGEAVNVLAGSGGQNPVTVNGGGFLAAPEGSSLSPFYLSARVKPPVTGVITSVFAYRYHPVSGKSDFHTGLDIAAEEGRAILAALPGEVAEVGENAVYGKYIILKHATNLLTSYSHCSEIIAREGMAVRQGERIARVGQTGVATGPHLHFSVIVEGQFVDPALALSDSVRLVD